MARSTSFESAMMTRVLLLMNAWRGEAGSDGAGKSSKSLVQRSLIYADQLNTELSPLPSCSWTPRARIGLMDLIEARGCARNGPPWLKTYHSRGLTRYG